jgi:hypothetical protein
MNPCLRGRVVCLLLLAALRAAAQDVFVCSDSQGHKLSSDRPIAECLDREQKVVSPSGRVRRTLGPSLTAQERLVLEDVQKREAEEQARLAEERRRARALLTRYRSQAIHDQERAEALLQVDEVMRASQQRLQDLAQQRLGLDAELEFYQNDLRKAPPVLHRRFTENAQNIASQQRFMADQEEERKRINQRFNDELVYLKPRWALQATPAPAPTRAP